MEGGGGGRGRGGNRLGFFDFLFAESREERRRSKKKTMIPRMRSKRVRAPTTAPMIVCIEVALGEAGNCVGIDELSSSTPA